MAHNKRKLPSAQPDEGFLRRWSRRKRSARSDQGAEDQSSRHEPEPAPEALDPHALPRRDERDTLEGKTDADMPPIESLDENSDYSVFMSPKVSAALRRQALRKLFDQPSFNVRDKLDCHAGNFTKFEPLGDTITADMRHQMERAARLAQETLNEDCSRASAVEGREHSGSASQTATEIDGQDSGNESAGNERVDDNEEEHSA